MFSAGKTKPLIDGKLNQLIDPTYQITREYQKESDLGRE